MKAVNVMLVLLVLAGASFAAPAVPYCDYIIATSGYWPVYDNLTATTAGNCVNISASNVLLDCLGNYIDGNATGYDGIYVTDYTYDNITVINCDIRNFTDDGFNATYTGHPVDYVAIANSTFTNNNIGITLLGDHAAITDNYFQGNDYGIKFGGDHAAITDNYFQGNDYGITFGGNHSSIEYNEFDGDATSMLITQANYLDASHNNVSNAGYRGIDAYDITNSLFGWNHINNSDDVGLYLETDNLPWNTNISIYNNTATYSSNSGFELYSLNNSGVIDNELAYNGYGFLMEYADAVLVAGNGVHDNDGNGIEAWDIENVYFTDNTISDNGVGGSGYGAYISVSSYPFNTNVQFRYNRFDHNKNGNGLGMSYSIGGLIDQNNFTSNNFDGLYGEQMDNTPITGNLFYDNGDNGAELVGSFNHTVTGNNFSTNSEHGLHFTDSSVERIHGNVFEGNGGGLVSDISSSGASGFLVSGNTFGSTTDYECVHFDYTDSSEISGNNMSGCHDNGIAISNCADVDVLGNNVDNSGGGESAPAIDVYESSDVIVNGNTVSNTPGNIGIYMESSTGPYLVAGNEVYGSNGAGIYLYKTSDAAVEGNLAHNNSVDGIGIDTSDGAAVTGNDVYGNLGVGFFAGGADGAYFSGNTAHDNNNSGYYIINSDSVDISGETIYGNGVYGLHYISGSGLTINDSVAYSNTLSGFVLVDSDTVAMDHILAYSNGWDIAWFIGCTDCYVYNSEGYDDGFGYYAEDSSTVYIYDSTVHDQTSGHYGLEAYNNSYVYAENLRIYSNADSYLRTDSDCEVEAENLWLGYDDTYGINYGYINISDTTDAGTWNLLLDRGFVSMDSSDSDVAELNVSANITIRSGGCSGLVFYGMEGFPQTQAEIIAGGTEFTPAYSTCSGRDATFEVSGFTGYTAEGATLSSSGGDSTFTMALTGDKIVGDELTITVMDGVAPVSGAHVKAFYWQNGILNVIDLGNTNAQGKVTFTPAIAGSYKATAEKSGYYEEEIRFIVSVVAECTADADCAAGTVCTAGNCVAETRELPVQETPGEQPAPETPPAEQPGCTTNADCAYNEVCTSGSCVLVPAGACGEYSNHAWIGFNCCADADCGVGFACTNHNCVQSGPRETEVPGTGAAGSTPASTPQGGTPWVLVGVAVLIGAGIIWWLFVRKP